MSTKFEQLLDYLVNEDHEKANELFHEIVVEKSREIYENLIAEEEAEDEMDESAESDDEEMDESMEDDEQQDENMDLEDSYNMEDETGDDTDDFGGEISTSGDNFDAPADDAEDHEGQEDSAIMDIKNAIQELEAAFAELEAAQSGEGDDMGADMGADMDTDMGDEDDSDEMMGSQAFEGRRVTREYVEKVGHDFGKAQKTDGDYAGAGSGEQLSKPVMGKSPISSGKGKPTTGATAGNILGDQKTAEGHTTGTTPNKVNKGITPEKGEQFTGKDWETNSKAGGSAGVKNLKKVGAGYPGNNKTPGPVGSGGGDKAGQTSIDPATKRQFLPQHTK
jgi:hypothetical protein